MKKKHEKEASEHKAALDKARKEHEETKKAHVELTRKKSELEMAAEEMQAMNAAQHYPSAH